MIKIRTLALTIGACAYSYSVTEIIWAAFQWASFDLRQLQTADRWLLALAALSLVPVWIFIVRHWRRVLRTQGPRA